jgi:hypothetical protein
MAIQAIDSDQQTGFPFAESLPKGKAKDRRRIAKLQARESPDDDVMQPRSEHQRDGRDGYEV